MLCPPESISLGSCIQKTRHKSAGLRALKNMRLHHRLPQEVSLRLAAVNSQRRVQGRERRLEEVTSMVQELPRQISHESGASKSSAANFVL